MKMDKRTQEEMNHMEIIIGKIMRVGVATAAVVMLIGYILMVVKHSTGYPSGTFPTTLTAICQGIIQLKPYAIMMGGIFLLILTPALRVATSIYTFFKEHDKLYTIVTTAVLVILLISFFLGHTDH